MVLDSFSLGAPCIRADRRQLFLPCAARSGLEATMHRLEYTLWENNSSSTVALPLTGKRVCSRGPAWTRPLRHLPTSLPAPPPGPELTLKSIRVPSHPQESFLSSNREKCPPVTGPGQRWIIHPHLLLELKRFPCPTKLLMVSRKYTLPFLRTGAFRRLLILSSFRSSRPILSKTTAFSVLLLVRLLSATYSTIPDCDEGP